MVVTYADLAYFDDILVDCLVDRLYYWAKTRKVKEYKPVRGIPHDLLLDIIKKDVIPGPVTISKAVDRFVKIPAVKTFLARFRDGNTKHEFERHVKRYLSVYSTDCGFGIEVTDRYLPRSKSVEACVVARRAFEPDEQIKHLVGFLSILNDEEEERIQQGKDFSIINSARRGANCLMLGPARFVNHDCAANARFASYGKSMFIHAKRKIHIGEEITVEYSPNYFGKNNRECLCFSCEQLGVNGFGQGATFQSPDSESEDSSDGESSESSRPRSRRSSSVETPTTSIEPEAHPPSTMSSERGSEEPESSRRKFRPRKSLDKKPKQVVKLSREEILSQLKRFQRNYNSEPFKPENEDNVLTCQNCDVPFVIVEEDDLTLRHKRRRYCPRCFRHVKLYNAYWPSMEALEDEIELYQSDSESDPKAESSGCESSESESESEAETVKRGRRRGSASKRNAEVQKYVPKQPKWKPLPAVPEENFKKTPIPRRMSAWMLKRQQEEEEEEEEETEKSQAKRVKTSPRMRRTKSMPLGDFQNLRHSPRLMRQRKQSVR